MAPQSRRLSGIGVSPGRVVGVAVPMPPAVPEPAAGTPLAEDPDAAAARVAEAADRVRAELERVAARTSGTARDVLEATALMAADPALVADAQRRVRDGLAPERAVWEAAEEIRAALAAHGGYLAERARDVADVRDRVVAVLTGAAAPGVPHPGHPFVLVAEDLAPADTATLDPAEVLALVTAGGGPTSHTAILARALGIPGVVAAPGVRDVPAGATVLVDGGAGVVVVDPTPEEVASAEAAARARGARRSLTGPGRTRDGRRVALLANVGRPEEAAAAAEAGAEGVGLFRTEFCFLDRQEAPDAAEQVRRYREVLAAFPGRRVVVRTLDAGADKPLPFLTPGHEPNPALGVRGLRTAVAHPEVLDIQLAAIAEAAEAESADVEVMAPMVATPEEAAAFVERARAHGLRRAGVMVEVPSAALHAEAVLAACDFASIGTNDLTQYAIAADREVGALAALSSPWQPAVLRLVELTCRGAAAHGRPVGVCGEAAADPALAVVLVGLGVGSLSMAPVALPDVAAVLAAVTEDECRELARLALAARSADAARAAVREQLPVLADLGL
jgi:phosphotransferase system enzyme I (PtsI)